MQRWRLFGIGRGDWYTVGLLCCYWTLFIRVR